MAIPASKEDLSNAMGRMLVLKNRLKLKSLDDLLKYKGQIFEYDNRESYIRICVYPGADSRKMRKSKEPEINSFYYSLSYVSKHKGRLFEAMIKPKESITFTVKTSHRITSYNPIAAMGGKDRYGAIEQCKKINFIASQSFVWMTFLNSEMNFLRKYKK